MIKEKIRLINPLKISGSDFTVDSLDFSSFEPGSAEIKKVIPHPTDTKLVLTGPGAFTKK